jgi:DNA-binding MarR family transcriptional regulator
MAPERLSHLQRRILTWLAAEERRTRGTMSASHQAMARAMAHHKGILSTSLRNLEAKGLVKITHTPRGQGRSHRLDTGRARAILGDKYAWKF